MRNYILQIATVVVLLLFSGCQDAWENHADLADSTASQTLLETLEANSNYSNFVSALKTTGLNKTLSEPYMYTVWAPSNDVFTNLPDDTKELYKLVANHISKGATLTSTLTDTKRILMLSGKFIELDGEAATIDQIAITKKDQAATNGVVQFIGSTIEPRITIWQYIESYTGTNKHIEYLNSLSGYVFDPDSATITGYTGGGLPIYDTLSGMVWKNSFLDNVADLRSEDSTYTLIIIDDEAFDTEFDTYTSYFKITSATTDEALALNKAKCLFKITKDYVFTSSYRATEIPAMATSVDMVEVPVDKSLVYDSFQASNGWVHHITSCAVPLANKIQPIIIEAETLERFTDNFTIFGDAIDGYPAGYKRVRPDASGGFDYVLDNWTTTAKGSGLILHADEVASMRYKFYLKAVNDFRGSYRYPKDNDYILSQQLGITTLRSENNMIYDFNPMIAVSDSIKVTATSYDEAIEEEVGSYKFTSMREIYLWLSPMDNGAAITADYIKLVPDFE
ncbi:fasciclin domain-containing protein [Carboxylicivirga caseinilyticus]|uniref:fasciclin domain-containing protein n=1 Tax=Carboxylicivirga caseinilyticus TaxID=3417572 RepID=UPI003D332EB7|nr:fasciclin domain-containing protein [Marinilabiliaceae bacterium A049]